jgi:light-regulated signal transduction histidine kinase (bacteriophytochrome)
MRTATGEYGWVRHHGIPCFDARQEFTGYVGSSFDITDLKQGNEELLRETKRLFGAKQDLEDLAQNAAHDLQEPLRNLEAILQRVEGASRADADALTRASLAQIRRVRALVRDIADYARGGKGELALAVSDPAESLDWALSNLRERIEECSAVIEVEPLPRAMADPIQLGRLFQNLVANALNFAGAEPPMIVVSGVRSGDEVQLWVRDDGIGIDPAHHSAIFSAFHRLHGETIAGTGMGLAICRQIVSRHGGRIWVESEPGRGSSFFFTLPAA